MQIGFELPNRPDFGTETWDQVDALRSTVVKVRPYHLLPDTLDQIRRRGLSVILRNDADGAIDVPVRVQELSSAAWKLREHGIGDITIIIDNEPNHTGGNEPDKPCPPDYWQKVSQVVTGLYYGHFDMRPLAGTVRYGSPPMAVAQGEAAWYEAGKDIIPAFDVVCVHLYGTTDNSLVTYSLQLVSVFGKPIVADELGNTDHHLSPDNKAFMVASFARQAAEAGVEAATIFIAKTPTPEWDYCTLPTHKLGMIADATIVSSVPIVTPEPEPQPEAMPMRTWTREEIIERIIGYADAAGVPRRLALACGIAESNLRQYAERYGTWPDVSFGIGQQIVLYAPVGNRTNTPENIALVRDWLFDPENAIPLMVGKLAENYDNRRKAGLSDADAQWAALYRYNTGTWLPPGGQYAGNVENYRRAFVAADAILATWEDELTPERKAEVKVGLDKLWALASAFEQNNDQPNADYIKAEVIRIKDVVRL